VVDGATHVWPLVLSDANNAGMTPFAAACWFGPVHGRIHPAPANSAISNEKEDTGKDDFKANDLAFMVNYPFVYADVAKDKKGAREPRRGALPVGHPGPAEPRDVQAASNLGISKYSKHQQLAFEAAKCIAQPGNQIVTSEKGGLAPTQAALLQQPGSRRRSRSRSCMQATLTDGVARPVLPAYSDISLAIQDALHPRRASIRLRRSTP